MRSRHLAAEYLGQLQLLCIAGAVSHRALGRDRDDAVFFVLRRALLKGADHVLTNVAREPFINCIVF